MAVAMDDHFWRVLASSVAHDVNNVLAGALSALDQASTAQDPAQRDDALAELKQGLGRIRAIAMDLRALGGRKEAGRAVADLGSAAQSALRLLSAPLVDHAPLAVVLPAGLLVEARTSELIGALGHLFFAVSHAQSDRGGQLRVRLDRSEVQGWLTVEEAGVLADEGALAGALERLAALGAMVDVQATVSGRRIEVRFMRRSFAREAR